jgi:hypothetical protein
MNWLCGALSFLWFCPSANLVSNLDFENHLKFFSDLDIVLSVPEEVCPEIKENLMQFNAVSHLVHDERLEVEIGEKRIDLEIFSQKMITCLNDCTCGALLTLEGKVSPKLSEAQTKKLQERLELLTNDYYKSCQKKIQLTCDTQVVKEISRKAAL